MTINLVVLFLLERRENTCDIKTKDMKPKTVKTIDKAIAWTERVKYASNY